MRVRPPTRVASTTFAALTPLVDAFFVMEYSPNVSASSSASSPLTSGLFSDQTTVDEYASVVPSSKVILGLPYFGIDWPTNNGTLTATATGPATDVSLGQILSSGHPMYWDPVTPERMDVVPGRKSVA